MLKLPRTSYSDHLLCVTVESRQPFKHSAQVFNYAAGVTCIECMLLCDRRDCTVHSLTTHYMGTITIDDDDRRATTEHRRDAIAHKISQLL